MDEGLLSTTDEGKIRSSVDAKFQASQTKLEEKIQNQRDRYTLIASDLSALKREIAWLSSIHTEGISASKVNSIVQQV